MINLHERMLPTSAVVEPATSWSPVGRRIQLSHRGRLQTDLRKCYAAAHLFDTDAVNNFVLKHYRKHQSYFAWYFTHKKYLQTLSWVNAILFAVTTCAQKKFILVVVFKSSSIFTFPIVKLHANYAEICSVGNLETNPACSVFLKVLQYCCETTIIQRIERKMKNIFFDKHSKNSLYI